VPFTFNVKLIEHFLQIFFGRQPGADARHRQQDAPGKGPADDTHPGGGRQGKNIRCARSDYDQVTTISACAVKVMSMVSYQLNSNVPLSSARTKKAK
jgi:hypothetical protein